MDRGAWQLIERLMVLQRVETWLEHIVRETAMATICPKHCSLVNTIQIQRAENQPYTAEGNLVSGQDRRKKKINIQRYIQNWTACPQSLLALTWSKLLTSFTWIITRSTNWSSSANPCPLKVFFKHSSLSNLMTPTTLKTLGSFPFHWKLNLQSLTWSAHSDILLNFLLPAHWLLRRSLKCHLKASALSATFSYMVNPLHRLYIFQQSPLLVRQTLTNHFT